MSKELTAEEQIRQHAVTLLRFYYSFKTTKGGMDFDYNQARQAYRDGLESMRRLELIKDYNLNTPEITWMDDVTQTVKVPQPIILP